MKEDFYYNWFRFYIDLYLKENYITQKEYYEMSMEDKERIAQETLKKYPSSEAIYKLMMRG